jgi:hypothetical protein
VADVHRAIGVRKRCCYQITFEILFHFTKFFKLQK